MKKLFVILVLLSKIIIASDISKLKVEVYALEALPYCGLINGEPAGIAIDILNEASKYGAPKFIFNFSIPWLRAQDRVMQSKGELVAIIPFSRTEMRNEQYKWIAELVTTQSHFYTINRDEPIQSIDEAKKLKIGLVRGHALRGRLWDLGVINLDDGAINAEANARKLLSNRFDALADSDLIFWYSWKVIRQNPDLVQEGAPIGDITGVYIAGGLNFPNSVARSIFDAVEQMKEDGKLEEIIKRWR